MRPSPDGPGLGGGGMSPAEPRRIGVMLVVLLALLAAALLVLVSRHHVILVDTLCRLGEPGARGCWP